MEEPSNLQNELQTGHRMAQYPDLAAWSYGLQMQFGGQHAYYEMRQWHPRYGTLVVDKYAVARDVGSVTASYIVSALWVGATELLERTVD